MPRKRTYSTGIRNRQVLIRLTDEHHARLAADAHRVGMTVSGLCEQLVRAGKIEIVSAGEPELHPALFAELRRIGNNINQLAHCANNLLPPNGYKLAQDFDQLFKHIIQNELIRRRMNEDLRTRMHANDSAPPQARDQFQGSVQVHPARRWPEEQR